MRFSNDECWMALIDEINKNGKAAFSVYRTSMIPTLTSGQQVLIHMDDDYKIGDIIAYRMKNNNKEYIVIHRVVFVRKSYVLAKGDNNDFIDPLRIQRKDIIGKVEPL